MVMQTPVLWDSDYNSLLASHVSRIAARQPGLRIGEGQEARVIAEVDAERFAALIELYNAGLLDLSLFSAVGQALDDILAEEGLTPAAGETPAQKRARFIDAKAAKGTGSKPFNRQRVLAIDGVRDTQSSVNATTTVVSYYILQDFALDTVSGQQPGFPNDALRGQALAALRMEPAVEGMEFLCPQPTVTAYYIRVVAVHDSDVTTAAELEAGLRAALTPLIAQESRLGEPVRQLELQRCLYAVGDGIVSGEVYLGTTANPTATADLPANGTPPESLAYFCPAANVAMSVT